jgi:hypothetical protein
MIGLRTLFQGCIYCHCVNDLAPSGDSIRRSPWPLSEVWVCGHSLVRIAGLNPAGDVAICILIVACCQVEVSASPRSLVQRSPIECGVSECVWF